MTFFLFQNSIEFPYPDKICEMCLKHLKSVVEFKHRCEIAFEQLIKLNDASNKIGEQNIEHQPTVEHVDPIFEIKLDTVEIIENRPLENESFSKFEVNHFD